MKTWMKVLMWLGLGGGIGFFAGYQVGNKVSSDAANKMLNEADQMVYDANKRLQDVQKQLESYQESGEHISDVRKMYAGEEDPGEPEMPEEIPVIGDEEEIEEIPELHPQHMIPQVIDEDYFYTNPENYDQESLLYYEVDKVLYNKDTRKAITNKDEIDQIIGIGTLFSFYNKDGDLDVIFVENATMGVLFRIDRVDAAFGDILSGAPASEYDEEDDTE